MSTLARITPPIDAGAKVCLRRPAPAQSSPTCRCRSASPLGERALQTVPSLPSLGPSGLSVLTAPGLAVRGGWCPFCDLQLRAYQASLAAIQAHGATLVAISPQTPDYSLSDVDKKALAFSVLGDVGNRVAREYGLVVQLSEVLQNVQAAFDAPLPRFNADDSWQVPTPAVFVVDRAGVVRFAAANADYAKRVEPQAIIDALAKLAP